MSGKEREGGEVPFGPAVSLSYDGADPSHLEVVLPCLDEFGLRATFYVTEAGLLENPRAWQAAQNEGHEIGCHSLLEAADGFGNLPRWTLENVEADLRAARKLLIELFPRQADFSFAYPGVEAACMSVAYQPEPASYRPVVENLFSAARSAREGVNDPARCDLQALESVHGAGFSADDLVSVVCAIEEEGKWAIFVFRGVGSGEEAVDASAHRELCSLLADKEGAFRVGPVFALASVLREMREAVNSTYSWTIGSGEAE